MISETQTLMTEIKQARQINLKDPNRAFNLASIAHEKALKLGVRSLEAASLFEMALACRSMTKLESCYVFVYDAFQIFEELDDSAGIASSLNLISVVYFYNGMYEQSLEKLLHAKQLALEIEDDGILTRIYNNEGEVYREVGEPEEALLAYERALEIAQKHNNIRNQAVILMNMGWVYFDKGNLTTSFDYYQKSYAMLLEIDEVTGLAEIENKIGKVYYLQNNYEQAKHYYMQALNRLESIGNKYYTLDILINLAEFNKQEDEEAYLNYLLEAIDHAEEIQASQHLSRIFNQLSAFYESKGLYGTALKYYKKYHHIEQVIGSTTMSQKLELMKIGLNKIFAGRELEEISKLNAHLINEISTQDKILQDLERKNLHLSGEVFYDELTKLANRKYFTKHLNELWSDVNDSNTHVALLLIDIDHFKRYNDFHGHIEGDYCLQKVGNCMRTIIENYGGMLGRFGGEEFVVFLKHINEKKLAQITEEVRTAVETMSLLYCWEQHAYPVTISIGGIHGIRKQFENKDEMYVIADKELYKAKTTGRNRVSIFSEN
ncbi:tetratricopeptide repeat-containing diguanylate cyclase [Psychrobacillus antarcticus]|uniref:tetratricopeptide repeat-containing diguanylate cyclase n=1 Tax=Psychrobacillus antarcticus TaxID=2879115 RepID=UPI002408370D|nr:tetratricopeptide repeat-containing diguanylate cyclase [Psychrobacillus antarcticus]